MIMDSALFITSLFALVSALTTFFSADQAIGYGLITLLLVGLVGGFAFYLMYYFVYQYYGPDMDRSQRPPFWKSVLVILASSSFGCLFSLQQASYQLALTQSLLQCH